MRVSTWLYLLATWFFAVAVMFNLMTVVPESHNTHGLLTLLLIAGFAIAVVAATMLRFRLSPLRNISDRRIPFWLEIVAAVLFFMFLLAVVG